MGRQLLDYIYRASAARGAAPLGYPECFFQQSEHAGRDFFHFRPECMLSIGAWPSKMMPLDALLFSDTFNIFIGRRLSS